MTNSSKPCGVILLIERKKENILLLNQTLCADRIRYQLKITQSGNEAILYLKGNGIYHDRLTYPMPSIILLDVNNSDGSSMALIRWIREQRLFFSIPIVLLGDDDTSRDLQRGLDLGANAYFVRKDEQEKLTDLIKGLELVDHKKPESNSGAVSIRVP